MAQKRREKRTTGAGERDAVLRALEGGAGTPARMPEMAGSDQIARQLQGEAETGFGGGAAFAPAGGYSAAPPVAAPVEEPIGVRRARQPDNAFLDTLWMGLPGLSSWAGGALGYVTKNDGRSFGDHVMDHRRVIDDFTREKQKTMSAPVREFYENVAPIGVPFGAGLGLGAKATVPLFASIGFGEGYMAPGADIPFDDPMRSASAIPGAVAGGTLAYLGAKAPAIWEAAKKVPGKVTEAWNAGADGMLGQYEKWTELVARANRAVMNREQQIARFGAEDRAFNGRMAQEQAWNDVGTQIDEAARGRASRDGQTQYGEMEASDQIARQLQSELATLRAGHQILRDTLGQQQGAGLAQQGAGLAQQGAGLAQQGAGSLQHASGLDDGIARQLAAGAGQPGYQSVAPAGQTREAVRPSNSAVGQPSPSSAPPAGNGSTSDPRWAMRTMPNGRNEAITGENVTLRDMLTSDINRGAREALDPISRAIETMGGNQAVINNNLGLAHRDLVGLFGEQGAGIRKELKGLDLMRQIDDLGRDMTAAQRHGDQMGAVGTAGAEARRAAAGTDAISRQLDEAGRLRAESEANIRNRDRDIIDHVSGRADRIETMLRDLHTGGGGQALQTLPAAYRQVAMDWLDRGLASFRAAPRPAGSTPSWYAEQVGGWLQRPAEQVGREMNAAFVRAGLDPLPEAEATARAWGTFERLRANQEMLGASQQVGRPRADIGQLQMRPGAVRGATGRPDTFALPLMIGGGALASDPIMQSLQEQRRY